MRALLFLTVAVIFAVGALAAPPARKAEGDSEDAPADSAVQGRNASTVNDAEPKSLSQKVQDEAKSLPTLLEKQWTERLSQQKANFSAAAASLTEAVSAEAKAAVTQAVAKLQELDTKIAANLSSLANEINKDVSSLIQKYTTLIKERSDQQASGATDESPIHDLRKVEQTTLTQWVTKLGEINEAAHGHFQKAIDTLSKEAADKSSDRQVGDQIRVAIVQVGVPLLDNMIQQQNEAITLLTSKDFAKIQEFTQNAETLLNELLVAAKQNPAANKQGDAQDPTEQGDAEVPTEQGDAEDPTEQEGDAEVPTEQEGDAKDPTEQEGDAKVPTEQGDAEDPTEQEGDAKDPTEQEGDAKDPTEQGDAKVPTEQGDAKVPTKQGDAPAKVSNQQ